MADELEYSSSATVTPYAIIRDGTKVWDLTNTEWATWADADIDDYDITLDSKGGDYYAADFPTDIAANTVVHIMIYDMAGASPALTDLRLTSYTRRWIGTLSVDELGDTDLTSIGNVKSYLGLTGSAFDTILGALVTAMSRQIERVCDRHFWAADYAGWHDGRARDKLVLPEPPIRYVERVAVGRQTLLSVSCTPTDAVRGMIRSDGTTMTLVIVGGTSAASDALTLADYAKIDDLQAAIDALTGWTATLVGVTGEYPTADLCKFPAWDAAGGSTVGLEAASDPLTGYIIDAEAATLIRRSGGFPTGWQNIYIEYNAGYATLPADLELTVRMMVADAFRARKLDANLKSEKLGDHSWTRAAGEAAEAARDTLLNPWRWWKLA